MKKTLKSFLALLLCLLMATSTVVSAFAAGSVSGIYKNNRWEYNGAGRLTIYPYDVDVTYTDSNSYTDDEGNTVYYQDCYFDEESGRYVIYNYSYDSILNEIDPGLIQEIVIAEGVESLDISELALCTEVQNVSIPASLNYGLSGQEIETELNYILDNLNEEAGMNIELTGSSRALVYAILETIVYEENTQMTLPLSAKQFTVANGNPLFKAVNGKLYTAGGKVLLRQSADVKQLTFDLDPFIDPIALCGITGADVTITDAYADAFYGAKDQIVSLLNQLKAELSDSLPDDLPDEADLEFTIIRDLLDNAAPVVDEIIDLIFTLEMSLFSAKSFTVSDSNAYLKTVNGVLYNKDMTALIKYPVASAENTYTMPASVTKYSLPFLAIDPVSALRCVYKVYDIARTGELNVNVKDELKKVILVPSVTVKADGRNLNAYFEGSSYTETLFYNALNTVLDYYAAQTGLEEQLGQDMVTNLKLLSDSAAKIALGIVKMIGTSKVVLDTVLDQYAKGVTIYNSLIRTLHTLTDVARAVAKGSEEEIREALFDFFMSDLFVQPLGEDVANALYTLAVSVIDCDLDQFISTLLPLGADVLDVVSALIQKYELQQIIGTATGADPELIDILMALVPEGSAFLREPSYDNWKALCAAAKNSGMLDEETYNEAITEDAYNEVLSAVGEELIGIFDQLTDSVSNVISAMSYPESAMFAAFVNVVIDAVDALIDLLPQEIIIENHDHVGGMPVRRNNTLTDCTVGGSYDLVTYCTICGEEMSRETVTVTPRAHDFGEWKPSASADSGYARTCTLCGTVDPFIVPDEPVKVLSNPEDGVVIEGSNEAIESGITLETKRISNSVESEDYVEEWFMVKLMKDGVEVQPNAPIVLKLEYPNWVKDPENLQLWHYTNGRWVRMSTWLEKPNYICCVTDSLSPFKWTEETGEPEHVPGEAVKENVAAATCTVAGSYDSVVYCVDCGEEIGRETVTVPAFGHEYNAVVTAPTYAAEGYTTYTCSRCTDTYKDNFVPALENPLDQHSLSMTYKTTANLTTKIEKGDGLTITWTSSDEKVAKVDRNGKVTATGKGDATITCTITDAQGHSSTDSCKVTVNYDWWQWLIKILLFGWIWY